MAPNKSNTTQQRQKNNWFLGCFGITYSKIVSDQKQPDEPGGRRRLFKSCLPKMKVMRKKKKEKNYSFDAKKVALKATQNMIMLEANKVKQLNNKLEHGLLTQESGDDHHHNLESPKDESNTITCRPELTPMTVDKCNQNKVTKDSLTGMLIITTMLITMSIWGRLCAILCMSVWLYCVPIILRMYRNVSRPNPVSINTIDVGSKLYNKKVELLERDNNNNNKIGIGVS